jgi:HAD superfamily hydrolase (TIGR01549 family)
MALRWLFIDIGGPILDDGPLFDYLAAALRGILVAQGNPITGEKFQEAMQLGWRQGAPSTLDFIVRHFTATEGNYQRAKAAYWEVFRGLSDEEYGRLQILRPSVPQALEILSGRYELATLSNNIVRVKELLEEYDIARFFSISGISEEVGYSKPDHRLFQHVLQKANCRPAEAMMVGDRLDNDILPAKKLGLITAQVMLDHSFGAPPPDLDGIEPDLRVSSVRELSQKLVPNGATTIGEKAPRLDNNPSWEGGAQ